MASSEIHGFYKLSVGERLQKLREFDSLSDEEVFLLKKEGALGFETADRMVENVVSTHSLPLGIAAYFRINGKDCLVPMALEEPSVVAAASNAAKLARESGGFHAESTQPLMIGQVQLVGVNDPEEKIERIMERKRELLGILAEKDAVLVKHGGGPRDISAKVIDSSRGRMLVVEILVDVRDAMGANAVNTMCEALAPELERLTGGKARLRIISNLAVHRLARAKEVWKKEAIGEEAVEGVLDAFAFAESDVFRCATHNKGIMNGIDAVAVATGNDWRAVEAGAHAYASLGGRYRPLTRYEKDGRGNLVGSIELPLPVGIIGGATKTHPTAKVCLKILGVKSAGELAQVMACVGLANNFAALRALSTEGIQRGHMELHARNIAVAAGAEGKMIDRVAEVLSREKNFRVDRAKEILGELKKKTK